MGVMDRRTRREHFSSAALSRPDDLLHRNILLLSRIRQRVAARIPQHVGWMGKWHACPLPQSCHQRVEALDCHWAVASVGTCPPVMTYKANIAILGQELVVLAGSNEREIDSSFVMMVERQIGALVATTDGFLISRQNQIVALSETMKLLTLAMGAVLLALAAASSANALVRPKWVVVRWINGDCPPAGARFFPGLGRALSVSPATQC
jgi:hypothetical protein